MARKPSKISKIEKTFNEYPKIVTTGKGDDGKDVRVTVNNADEEAKAVSKKDNVVNKDKTKEEINKEKTKEDNKKLGWDK